MTIDEVIEEIARGKRIEAKELRFFDANVWLGKPEYFPLAEEMPARALADTLGEYQIQGALVSHWDSLRLSAQEGNEALLAAANDVPDNVWTVWTGLPLVPREQDPLPGFSSPHPRMRGVRLFPKSHHFQLSPWVIGGLCEWCISHAIPLFLWHVEIDWDPAHSLASAFPKLRIVIETQWQKILYHNRNLFSLLEACGNVVVESSNFIGQDFVTYLVKNWGAERLLFGSFLPVNDPNTMLGMIMDSDISKEEKLLIAGGNARAMVAGVKP
jgi:hypothetical protein